MHTLHRDYQFFRMYSTRTATLSSVELDSLVQNSNSVVARAIVTNALSFMDMTVPSITLLCNSLRHAGVVAKNVLCSSSAHSISKRCFI